MGKIREELRDRKEYEKNVIYKIFKEWVKRSFKNNLDFYFKE